MVRRIVSNDMIRFAFAKIHPPVLLAGAQVKCRRDIKIARLAVIISIITTE